MIRNTLLIILGLITFNCYSQCPPTFSSITSDSCYQYTSPSGNYVWYSSGIYEDTLFGANSNGCDSIITIDLTINSMPNVYGGVDALMCETSYYTLTGSGADSYTWNNGVVDGVPFTPPVGTNYYTVTGTDVNGCSGDDNVTVTVEPLPIINLPNDTTFCDTSIVIIDAGNGSYNYSWSNGDATQFLTTDTSGIYSVYVVSQNGCAIYDSIEIFIDDCLGLIDFDPNSIEIYPNPAENIVSINNLPLNVEIDVFSVDGIEKRIDITNSNKVTNLNMNNVPTGSYLIFIKYDSKILVKRIIKL